MFITFIINFFKSIFYYYPVSFYYFIRKPIRKDMMFGMYSIVASFGQGKTLTMVKLALDTQKRLKKKGIDCVIYSNMSTSFSTKLNSLDDIVLIAEEQQELKKKGIERQVLFLLDEIQTVFNSRKYQSLPLEIISILCGNRHLNMCFIYTCQATFSMDKYLRELCNGFIYVRKLTSYCYCYFKIRDRKRLEIMEEWCKIPPIFLANKIWLVNPLKSPCIFDMYNTHEDMNEIMLEHKDTSNNRDMLRARDSSSPVTDKQLKKFCKLN